MTDLTDLLRVANERAEAAEHRVGILRSALEAIAGYPANPDWDDKEEAERAKRLARAALNATE